MTVTVANNYNLRKALPRPTEQKRNEKKVHSTIGKVKQSLRKEMVQEEEDDETMTGESQ